MIKFTNENLTNIYDLIINYIIENINLYNETSIQCKDLLKEITKKNNLNEQRIINKLNDKIKNLG